MSAPVPGPTPAHTPGSPIIPGAPIETDALVIGAGPVGLFLVFELGLLELGAQVVDALPHAGGQCAELYPAKPIYDIPGLPMVSGAELVERLQAQAAPFKPGWHLGQQVETLAPLPDGRWAVGTDRGSCFHARSVFIAAGAGAFVPRSIALEGLSAHVGRQVLYAVDEPTALAGRQVLILGDEDPALEQAITLASLPPTQRPARTTLIHRRAQFRASPDTLARFQALRGAGALHFVAGQPQALLAAADAPDRLQALQLLPPEGDAVALPLDTLLIRLGLSPRLGPIADWGLALERKQVPVDTARFETALPGVHAVGDINTYAGKRKLLLCGFYEATLAAYAAAERLRGAPVLLQYTTTSPRLHALLGVNADGRQRPGDA